MRRVGIAPQCAALLVAAISMACGTALPTRYVLERDVDGFAYRRYQHVLDVEIPLQGNDAEGHTATYFRRGESGVVLATAFVTVYAKAPGLAAEIRERMEDLTTYQVSVEEREGEHVWVLAGDAPWLLWVSGRHVVKLGGPMGGGVPESLAEAYLDLYPSDLDERGSAEAGASSAGASHREEEESEALEVPQSLQEGTPR